MDLEQQEIVRLAVEDILAGADMENITEKQVRKLAADKTGLDLSHPVGRKLVLSMISAFLDGNGDKAEEEVESEEDDEEKTKKQKKKRKTTKARKVIEAHVCFDVRFFCFAMMA
jgi:ABC-type Zn2+ transport system substrate-binding protein/surface adhesin